MAATVELDHPDQSESLVATELDLDQRTRQTESLGADPGARPGEHALERTELLAVVVGVDEHLFDQLVQFGIGPGTPHSLHRRAALKRVEQT